MTDYSIHTDVKFGPLEVIDVGRRAVVLMVEAATIVPTGDQRSDAQGPVAAC